MEFYFHEMAIYLCGYVLLCLFRDFDNFSSKVTSQDVTYYVCIIFWILWKYLNEFIFGTMKPKRDVIFYDIVSYSSFWISQSTLFWDCYLDNPCHVALLIFFALS